jgi:hypothetical protein
VSAESTKRLSINCFIAEINSRLFSFGSLAAAALESPALGATKSYEDFICWQSQ